MKKIMSLFLVTVLGACTATHSPECQPGKQPCRPAAEYKEVCQVPARVACPCANPCDNSCRCAYRPDNSRPVLHPRVTEVKQPVKMRRHCPPDNQMVNCGCGYCKTFQNQAYMSSSDVKVSQEGYAVTDYVQNQNLVPVMPEAYTLAANRVLTRMLKDSASIYGENPGVTVFFKEPHLISSDLPGGSEEGIASMKRQLSSAQTFVVNEDLPSADYYVDTIINWFDTPSKTVPAIKYQAILYNREGNKINEWVEVIKQADNSQVWL